ncbi:RNA-directed DNA polymerase [Microbacterium sp. EYE_5]|uniref:antiviral reverse transcriptase Drt3b n=1 Tax=unclassified Microbacterium TaxID=2609290 RepID=UPI002002B237|nr:MULTISPECIES: antiviral reverse transcriptase Drt3b [unclassified Microbacterium]MCK6081299.1 RNA-directed DNA polymerase [Microbacterium sp. EYE_382]MCK6086569.1 RNA-directed DNA polymerase [Microbacterium sp. EYE_384]MCK6123933.1 RNA-directed DNA polymerase [Microbacterium sp. EYE_80]MCK6126842.1 RNA-directed DNA polymerase [Microbacterium sp. EYE_79]MCK6142254.1 RNA-directed DNA polymerase [Microbacterium sp. EYE_39]
MGRGILMGHSRATRDPLRALTSEILPYEVPIPFDVTRLYRFLRGLKFTWIGAHQFSVLDSRLGLAEKQWLALIFDPIKLGAGTLRGGRREFRLTDGGTKCDLRYPFKFRSRRNNGKSRVLSVPHPHSMLQMASFVHENRDSILYYTNRSGFSIRHPHRVARVQVRPESVFDGPWDRESYGFEQSDLEYEHVSSYFSYRKYNNINRFYSSPEFQACERKFPHLMRADVAKCFDSVYTHTVSWVTNGIYASKHMQRETKNTFGGRFDHLMQYLNYAETSGIIIGPELSRVFAEIILQEVDVRVEREMANVDLVRGSHYEIMRYVDDYFVFLADPHKALVAEEIIATQLASFKLHLNEQKQRHFDTPLQSHMSVAKVRIREDLKRRTVYESAGQVPQAAGTLFFSSRKAILDYKALLIDTGLEHGELANSYLYELGRRRDKTVRRFRKQLDEAIRNEDPGVIDAARRQFVNYLIAVLDVGLFIYSGAPSVSHSVKLTRMVAASMGELEVGGFGALDKLQFRDRVRRELVAQLTAVHDEASFGAHTLLLIDCLLFVEPEIPETILLSLLERRGRSIEDLDAFGVLTMLRRFMDPESLSPMKTQLLDRAQRLIEYGMQSRDGETARALLLLSLPTFPGATPAQIAKAMGDGYSRDAVRRMTRSRRDPSMFSWNASENYYERLLLKSAQSVY